MAEIEAHVLLVTGDVAHSKHFSDEILQRCLDGGKQDVEELVVSDCNHVDLYVVELVATIPSLFQMISVLLSSLGARTIGPRRATIVGLVLCGVAALGGSLATVVVAAFLVGYSMMALVPHLQENVSLRCADLGTLLGTFLPALTGQFLVCAVAFAALAVVSWAMARRAL